MNTKTLFLLGGLLSLAGVYALARPREDEAARKALPKDPVKNWENEGGNVPNVPTPSP
jgi:hypothetical protein